MLWLIKKLFCIKEQEDKKPFQAEKTPAEHYARLNAVLQNIESYNGTSEGQKQI